MPMVRGYCSKCLVRVNVLYRIKSQRWVRMKLENGAFYGTYTAILREDLQRKRSDGLF